MPVEQWGDYEVSLDRPIGSGGMGTVYRGRQISLDREVAIKVLNEQLTSDPSFLQRFQREASLLAKLNDPHVVQVFGAGHVGPKYFYAMELIDGTDLGDLLRLGRRFSPDEVVRIGYHTGRALQAAWKRKIIHRDIKPSNIIITRENHVKVMDFGLAKGMGRDITISNTILGTAKYMSPEQATGSITDIRSDLYSLGAVLFELATGEPPFSGENPTAVVYQHVHAAPPAPRARNPQVPPDLERVILKLLRKNPEDRYQTPEEVIEECRALREGRPPTGDVHPVEAAAEGTRANWAGIALGLVIAAGIIGAGGFFGWKRYRGSPLAALHGAEPSSAGPARRITGPTANRAFDAIWKRAGEAMDRKDWGRAEALLEAARRRLAEGDPRLSEVEEKIAYVADRRRGSSREKDREEIRRREERIKRLRSDAEAAVERKAWEEAIRAYRGVLTLLPPSDARRKDIAVRLKGAENEKKKEKEAGAEAEAREKRYRAARKEADRAAAKKDWDGSIRGYREAMANLPPNDARREEVAARLKGAETEKKKAEAGEAKPWEERYRRSLAEAEKAAAAKDWPRAIRKYRAALAELPEGDPRRKEIEKKIAWVRLEEELAAIATEPDLEKRIAAYRRLLSRDPDRIKARIRGASRELVAARMGKDWAGAVQALRIAGDYEPDEGERKKLTKKKAFCEDVLLGLRYEKEQRWESAKEVWERLLAGEHFGARAFLAKKAEGVRKKIVETSTPEEVEILKRFKETSGEARRDYARGRWQEAHRKLEGLGGPEYRRFHDEAYRKDRKWARIAANPPAGMVFVPGGAYTIGEADVYSLNGPSWEARLKPYYIQAREVSQKEYREFLSAAGHKWCHPDEPKTKRHEPRRVDRRAGGEDPITWVDWWDAYAYARWKGMRLPTEAEFEVAASYDLATGRRRLYPWGDEFGEGRGASFFGLQGLDNDVIEWTGSEYGPYPGSRRRDERYGPLRKILRGGYRRGGRLQERVARCAYRHWWKRDAPEMTIGFRCVKEIGE